MRKIPSVLAFTALIAVSCTEAGQSPVGPDHPFETQPAFDDVPNSLDASVDAAAEVMPLVLGGPNGSTTLYVDPTNGDGKNGCNLTGSTTLVVSVSSSNTSVATVSPSQVTFTSCGDTPTLTIAPVGLGSATISLSQVSNSTDGTFNLAPATFTVTVAAPPPPSNTAPTVSADDDVTINEGGTFTQSGSFTDPDANTWTATVDYGDGSGVQPLTLNVKSFSLSHTYVDNGVYTVTVSVNDGSATGTDQVTVTVNNVAPTITGIAAPSSVNEGTTILFSVAAVTDPGTADVAAGFDYSFACGAGTFTAYGTTNSGSCAAPDGPATVAVRAKVRDKDGGESAEFSVNVTVNNVAPTATFSTPASPANEGTTFNVSLTNPQDVALDLPGLTYAFDCGSGYGSVGSATSATCPAGSTPGAKTVKGKVKDKDGGETEYTATVTISDVVPDITSVTGPALPVQLVGSSATADISVAFTGAAADDHTIEITCDMDGASTPITRTDAPGTFTQPCVYTGTGVYTVLVTVRDEDGSGIDDSYQHRYVVVYDPSAGFVTGGGWIQSQQSYCKNVSLCPNAGGKGSFGFVSKYLKGATVPTGNTEFQLQAGDFNLKSTDYQWLVVNQNGTNAQFKGTGTINGTGSYNFQIWATDANPDKFRIRVWQEIGGVEHDIYDNGFDQALNGTDGNGSIQIHVPKK